MSLSLLFVVAGLFCLAFGAEWLVRGGVRIARTFGVSPLAIGLTVVAYGTSAPELVASVVAAIQHHTDVTLGNVIGSNIANIGLILGTTALITPLAVSLKSIWRELSFLCAVTLIFFLLAFHLEYSRLLGIGFLATLVAFNFLALRWARREPSSAVSGKDLLRDDSPPQFSYSSAKSILLVVAGLCLLFGGGYLLVTGAVAIARKVGVSEAVIGVSLVAVGTSLPELATSVVAAARKEADICIGNILGSNLFNILGAIGLSASIRPLQVNPALLRFEYPAFLIFSGALAFLMISGRRITRVEGTVLLTGYLAFNILLFAR
jgi:cation:H+ antiporter